MVRIKSGGRFGFCVATVLVASSGDQVSCYTTEGGDVLLKDSSQKRKFKIIHTVRMTIFAVFRKL